MDFLKKNIRKKTTKNLPWRKNVNGLRLGDIAGRP
jgi:hypothetical protein